MAKYISSISTSDDNDTDFKDNIQHRISKQREAIEKQKALRGKSHK